MRILRYSTTAVILAGVISFYFPSTLYAKNDNKHEVHRVTFDGAIKNNTLAMNPNEKMAVVASSENSEVVIYDLVNGKVQGVLKNYVTPRNIIFAPDGKSFYISDSSKGVVDRIDSESFQTINQYAIGPGAFGTALNSDGKALYVNNQSSDTVTVMNTETGVAQAVIKGFAQPRQGVQLSPDGHRLYVTNFLGDKITIVDTAGNKIIGEISGFNKIRAISVTGDGKTLFAANSGSNTVAVVDIASQKIMLSIPVGEQPYGAALSPDGGFIYSGNLIDNSVSVIDAKKLSVITTITGFDHPRQALVFTRDNKYAYVLNQDLSLSKVERAIQKIIDTLKL